MKLTPLAGLLPVAAVGAGLITLASCAPDQPPAPMNVVCTFPEKKADPIPASPYPSKLVSTTPDGTLLYVMFTKNGGVYFTNKGAAFFQPNLPPASTP